MIASADFNFNRARKDRQTLVDVLMRAGAKFMNGGNSCRCVLPGHNDVHPSAGIYKKGGIWRYHCHVCNVDEDFIGIQALLKGQFSTEFLREQRQSLYSSVNDQGPARPRTSRRYPTASALIQSVRNLIAASQYIHPDTGLAEIIVIRKLDNGRKKILMARHDDDAYVFGGPQKKPWPLYARSEIRGAPAIVVVEGELCADVLNQLGIPATTTLGGAGKARYADLSILLGVGIIYLWPDNDEAGIRHMQDLYKWLIDHGGTVKFIDVPALSLPPKGDVVDWLKLRSVGTEHDPRQAIKVLLANATDRPYWERSGAAVPSSSKSFPKSISTPPMPLDEQAKLCTDIGNAARFVIQHQGKVKYCSAIGKWYYWCGTHWKADHCGKVMTLAKATALSIWEEARQHPDNPEQVMRWAKQSQSISRLTAMVQLAECELSVQPEEFDANPYLLNVRNGIVDLRTGKLMPHDPQQLMTKITRGGYLPDIKAPNFEKFLQRIFCRQLSMIAFLQRAIGYSATGITTEQCLFLVYGEGANGKTTLLDAVSYALGPYSGKADRDLLSRDVSAQHPTSMADLMGRRLVAISETNDGGRLDEAKLKDLVGETRIKARFMRQDLFEFQATHKLWMYSNHHPNVQGTDHGLWRRIYVIPFMERIREEEKDIHLLEKLQAEADGILSWIVEGAMTWYRDGLQPPQAITQATAEYRNEQNPIGRFLAEMTTPSEKSVTPSADIYACYLHWCDGSGEQSFSQKRLGVALREKGYLKENDSKTNRVVWRGISLNGSDVINIPP